MAHKRMKVGIVGHGYVGQAVHNFVKNLHNAYVCDTDEERISEDALGESEGTTEVEDLNVCDLVYITVPTPPAADGSCDTSIVEAVIQKLDVPLIILKSTVEPGTTERLAHDYGKHMVFSPEFAGESIYWSPYTFDRSIVDMPHYIFGGEYADCKKAYDFYIQIAGPTKKYFITDFRTAEMVKYVTNCFYATKVTFCNEMKELCDHAGISWEKVRELWVNDPRVNPMHTAVFEDNRGYGNKCFPKDVKALREFGFKCGFRPPLLSAVDKTNEFFRNKNKK